MTVETEHATTLREAIERRDASAITEAIVVSLESGDLADHLDDLTEDQLELLVDVLGFPVSAELFSALDAGEIVHLLRRFQSTDAARVLEEMSPDDATDVIAMYPVDEATVILTEMEPVAAAGVRELLAYPPDTAGGRMTPAFVAVSPDLRADQAVAALRQISQEAETINYVYVTDDEEHLLGVLSLRRLVLSPPDTPVIDLMVRDVHKVEASEDQEDAARMLNAHDLLALPVVDGENRLLGIITVDDVADILEEEATEDIERLGGSEPLAESYLRASPLLLWRKRVIWLLVLFVGAAYTTTVLEYFESEIQAAVALSFFIPLLIGTGGNVGSQVVTMIVRAMAVENITLSDVARVIWKEARTGIMLGVVMALVMFGRAIMINVGMDIALVVASAVMVIVIWATLVGAVLPLLLRRAGVDPAVVSSPLITTLVDGTGLIIYFSAARLVLDLN